MPPSFYRRQSPVLLLTYPLARHHLPLPPPASTLHPPPPGSFLSAAAFPVRFCGAGREGERENRPELCFFPSDPPEQPLLSSFFSTAQTHRAKRFIAFPSRCYPPYSLLQSREGRFIFFTKESPLRNSVSRVKDSGSSSEMESSIPRSNRYAERYTSQADDSLCQQ